MKLAFFALSAFLLTEIAFGSPIRPYLIGGKVVDQKDYPAIVWIGHCTATLVGPRTLLTAAHCAGKSEFMLNGQYYQVEVTESPDYNYDFNYKTRKEDRKKDTDIGLGIIDREVAGVTPMTIGGAPKAGMKAMLFGFGCSNKNGSGRDGSLRMGSNLIHEADESGMLLTGLNGGASGCPGDSGGPAFVELEDHSQVILGVTSEGGLDDNGDLLPETWDARTDTVSAQGFLKGFAEKNHLKICGINAVCK